MAKAPITKITVATSEDMLDRRVSMVDGEIRLIKRIASATHYVLDDKSRLPAIRIAKNGNGRKEIDVERYEAALKAGKIEDTGDGYARYTAAAPKPASAPAQAPAPKDKPAPAPAPKDKPQSGRKPATQPEPQQTPAHSNVVHIDRKAKVQPIVVENKFDKKVAALITEKVQAYLVELLPNLNISVGLVTAASDPTSSVLQAKLSIPMPFDRDEAIAALIEGGVFTDKTAKRVAAALSDEDLQEMMDDEGITIGQSVDVDQEPASDDDTDFGDTDFELDVEEKPEAEDDDFGLEEEPEASVSEPAYAYVALTDRDRKAFDQDITREHVQEFADHNQMDVEEFAGGLVMENGGVHFTYLGLDMNDDNEVVAVLRNQTTNKLRKPTMEELSEDYTPVFANIEEEDDEFQEE